jgi:hypothetical protein
MMMMSEDDYVSNTIFVSKTKMVPKESFACSRAVLGEVEGGHWHSLYRKASQQILTD